MKKLIQYACAPCMMLKISSRVSSYPTRQMVFTNTQFSKWRKTNAQDSSVNTEVKRGRSPNKNKYIQFVIVINLSPSISRDLLVVSDATGAG